jgi:hypothetical protein
MKKFGFGFSGSRSTTPSRIVPVHETRPLSSTSMHESIGFDDVDENRLTSISEKPVWREDSFHTQIDHDVTSPTLQQDTFHTIPNNKSDKKQSENASPVSFTLPKRTNEEEGLQIVSPSYMGAVFPHEDEHQWGGNVRMVCICVKY